MAVAQTTRREMDLYCTVASPVTTIDHPNRTQYRTQHIAQRKVPEFSQIQKEQDTNTDGTNVINVTTLCVWT